MARASNVAQGAQALAATKAAEASASSAADTDEAKLAAIARADQFPAYVSHKVVRVAIITQVLDDGCMVIAAEGAPEVKLAFPQGMTGRYQPVPGDRWMFYPDGYQSLSPMSAFIDGYSPAEEEGGGEMGGRGGSPDLGDDTVMGRASLLGVEHGIALQRNPDGSMTAHGLTEDGAEISVPIPANDGALYDLRTMIASAWSEVRRRVGLQVPSQEEG